MTATRFAKGATLVARRGGLARGRVASSGRRPCRATCTLPHVDPHRYSRATRCSTARRTTTAFLRWNWVAVTLVELGVLVVFVFLAPRIANAFELGRVGKGVHGRHGDDARRLGGRPSVRRSPRSGGAAATGSRRSRTRAGCFEQWPSLLAQVVGPDDRAHRAAPARRPLRPLLVARSPAPLFTRRRVRARASCSRTWITLGTRAPHKTQADGRMRAARAEGGRRRARRSGSRRCSDQTNAANAMATGIGPSARVFIWDTFLDGRVHARRGRGRRRARVRARRAPPHLEGRRLVALLTVPALLRARARRRAGAAGMAAAGGRAVRAARDRAVQPRDDAVRERRLAPLRGRGGLVGARATRDPASAVEPLPQVRQARPRAAGPARLVVHLDREPPDARAAHRDGAGLARPATASG